MSPDTWNYTLSTVAQVCAALVAIGGAVIVFKLDKIDKESKDFRDRLIKAILCPVTGKGDVQYYFWKGDDLVKEYIENKHVIIKNGVVDERVVDAIQRNYGINCLPVIWVKNTVSTYLTILNARTRGFKYFRNILILLISAVIFNILLSVIMYPNDCGANILFFFCQFFSILSIIISTWFSLKILTIDIFDYETLTADKKNLLQKLKIFNK